MTRTPVHAALHGFRAFAVTPAVANARSRRAGRVTIAVLLTLLAVGCVEVRQQHVEVTPGVIPDELRGARWQSLPVHYCIVEDNRGFVAAERFVELTTEAFERWGVAATYDGPCSEAVEGNGRSEVAWGSPDDTTRNHPEGGAYQVGWTKLVFRRCPSGCPGGAETEITEADILILPTPPDEFQTAECLFASLLHEAGHFFGVQHLESPAVMAPASDECAQQLTPADTEAIQALYR
ncbi:MAG: matrixin family metalloprotease [Dehalococcoidia bacterium]